MNVEKERIRLLVADLRAGNLQAWGTLREVVYSLSVAGANDDAQLTLEQIADLIEEYYLGGDSNHEENTREEETEAE